MSSALHEVVAHCGLFLYMHLFCDEPTPVEPTILHPSNMFSSGLVRVNVKSLGVDQVFFMIIFPSLFRWVFYFVFLFCQVFLPVFLSFSCRGQHLGLGHDFQFSYVKQAF